MHQLVGQPIADDIGTTEVTKHGFMIGNGRAKVTLIAHGLHGFKYRPILIYIGNIVLGFEVPGMILTL